jgi:hypothetical protein
LCIYTEDRNNITLTSPTQTSNINLNTARSN